MKKKKQEKIDYEKDEPREKSLRQKHSIVTWAVFLFAVTIVLINIVSIIFPALIASNNSTILELNDLGIPLLPVDPLFVGTLAYTLIATNVIVFGLTILYFKKRLPVFLSNSINFIFNFEISKKVALISMIIILAIYVAASANELAEVEQWEDYVSIKQRLENWSLDKVTSSLDPHVRYFFITSSMTLFGNDAVVPFLASIALVIMVYFLTKQITNKRFSGLVAAVLVLQSNVFLTFDTSVAYPNFWILFYVLSLYFVYKFWPLSPVSYILSIPSKFLTITFFPMSIYFLFRSSISKTKKIIISSSIIAVFVIASVVTSGEGVLPGGVPIEPFLSNEFWIGFTSFAAQLRFDGLVILFLVPLIVGLLLTSTKNKHAESMMVMMGGMLLIAPLLSGFTDHTNQPYRLVAFVTFFAVGVGILLTKTKSP